MFHPDTVRCTEVCVKTKYANIDWARYRREFPAAKRYVYFNHAAVSPLSTRVLEAMNAVSSGFLDEGRSLRGRGVRPDRKSAEIGGAAHRRACGRDRLHQEYDAGSPPRRGRHPLEARRQRRHAVDRVPRERIPVARPRETGRAGQIREAFGRQDHGGDARAARAPRGRDA